jgi:hypothetical protein
VNAADILDQPITEDLRYADLTKQVLFGRDFRGTNLYGATISLTCESFDGVRYGEAHIAQLLLMLASADIDPAWQAGLHRLVAERLGDSRYRALSRLMRIA